MMEEEVESKYVCPVCCEVLKRPTVLPCQHRFCWECIRSAAGHSDLCPVCRGAFTLHQCKHDKRLERDINSRVVQCQGCGQQCSLLHFNTHVVSCGMRVTPKPQLPSAASQPTSQLVNRATFNCPLCDQQNLDCSGLLQHCNSLHRHERARVVCPVCACMPWGDSTQVSSNFVKHLNLRHQFEYDTFVDYQQDEEQALQAVLEASRFEK